MVRAERRDPHLEKREMRGTPAGDSGPARGQTWATRPLDRKWRDSFTQEIRSIVRGFDIIVRQHQPNYRPGPD